jgi:hypothetical protein
LTDELKARFTASAGEGFITMQEATRALGVTRQTVLQRVKRGFRPRLATTPLRFANPSPPSGWVKDLHLQAVDHARHTKKAPPRRGSHWKRLYASHGGATPKQRITASRRVGEVFPLGAHTRKMSWLELTWIFVGVFVVAAALAVGFVLVMRLLGQF